MKKQFLTLFAIGGMVLSLGGAMNSANSTEAAPPDDVQLGGAAGLVAAVVQLQAEEVVVVDNVLNDSIKNIDILNNVLNRSLNNNDIEVNVITVEDALNDNVVTVDILNDALNDFEILNDVEVDIEDITAIVEVIGGGVLVLI